MSAFEVIIILLVFEAIGFAKFLYFRKTFSAKPLTPKEIETDDQVRELLDYNPFKNIRKRGEDA